MDADEQHLQELLDLAASTGPDPVVDAAAIAALGQTALRRRRVGMTSAVVAVVALLAVGLATLPGPEPTLSTVDDPTTTTLTTTEEITTSIPSTTTSAVQATTTTTEAMSTDFGDSEGFAPDERPLGQLRFNVSSTLLAPYQPLTITPIDPCPSSVGFVRWTMHAFGGTMDGQEVGGSSAKTDPFGAWDPSLSLSYTVGGVDRVAWAATADEVEVRVYCGSTGTPSYVPVRVRLARVKDVFDLTATWDGTSGEYAITGCPYHANVYYSEQPTEPPRGKAFTPVSGVIAQPGSAPGTWEGPLTFDHDASGPNGLWVSAYCMEPSGVTDAWRSFPVQLDEPG